MQHISGNEVLSEDSGVTLSWGQVDSATKARLIEKWREVSVGSYMWDRDIVEDFATLCSRFGLCIYTSEVAWTGFWSQGDGASFVGYIKNLQRFLTLTTGSTKTYPLVREVWESNTQIYDRKLDIRIERDKGARYVHEYTMRCQIESDYSFKDNVPHDCPLRVAAAEVWDEQFAQELAELEDHVRVVARRLAKLLYRMLEQEYDFLTSDDVVWDALISNDYLTPDDLL